MIFDNPRFSDISPELDLFCWQIVGCALPKNFALSTGEDYLKVALYQIDFFPIEHSSALQPKI